MVDAASLFTELKMNYIHDHLDSFFPLNSDNGNLRVTVTSVIVNLCKPELYDQYPCLANPKEKKDKAILLENF